MISTFPTKESLCQIISGARKILITTHLGPDGDAIGSSLGLALFIRKLNPETRVAVPNDYPDFLRWMPGNELIMNYMKQKAEVDAYLQETDLIFYLDYNEGSRGGQMEPVLSSSGACKVLIDHHLTPAMKTDYCLSDPNASSTAELVYSFIRELPLPKHLMDTDIATCLYAGILTDTGCFSFNSSRGETFRQVAALLDYGIDKDNIYSLIYDNFSAMRMLLLGHCLSNMQVFPEYKTAYMTLSLEDQKKFHYKIGDSEGFVNYPLSIEGISFSAFFIENEDKIKISFRSKGTFSVNQFARDYFNGGGHLNASGGDVYKSSLQSVTEKFVSLLPGVKDSII
ncbi:MAG: bifunctional oligoribonuclease/PAP phosphatase NrnA [Bacteroidales bacterium]|nr:bifunctional oligoribonuclease/PAP phosphatase NrnA [Bacteroidales bacterium]